MTLGRQRSRARLGIDVRYLSHGLFGGVHTYVAHFVPELITLASDHQIYLYADTKRPLELGSLPDHVTVRYLPWHNPMSSIYNDFTIGRWMAADRLDLVHFPANFGFGPADVRTVITLHDAINILPLREIIRGHPKKPTTMAMMTYIHYCTRAAMRRADLILTVSQHARREIARHSRYRVDRIIPVPHGLADDARRLEDTELLTDVRNRFGLVRPFVLADAIKNPAVLVKAWRLLPAELRESREIIFFSRRPDPPPIVSEAVAAGHARLFVAPSRPDLMALYSLAEVFAFPSWIEGFGIPVLEAMACGAPVIASDRGAIPEVAGGAALLSDAEDADRVAQNIALVFRDPLLAQRMRERGFAQAAQFSWRDTARLILDNYERTVGVS